VIEGKSLPTAYKEEEAAGPTATADEDDVLALIAGAMASIDSGALEPGEQDESVSASEEKKDPPKQPFLVLKVRDEVSVTSRGDLRSAAYPTSHGWEEVLSTLALPPASFPASNPTRRNIISRTLSAARRLPYKSSALKTKGTGTSRSSQNCRHSSSETVSASCRRTPHDSLTLLALSASAVRIPFSTLAFGQYVEQWYSLNPPVR
jgi:hypothetical protein